MSADEGVAAGRAGGRVVGADRWRRYESMADVGTPAGLAREVARHVRAARRLEILGDALAECAGHVAAVTAWRLAGTPSRTGEDHEVKAAAFDGWLASARGTTRAHLASLLEAALRAEWRSGTAGGLPRPKRTTFAADSCGTRADGIYETQAANSRETTADKVGLYRAAVGSADADVALAKAIDVVSDLTVVLRRSPVAQGAWAVLDEIAFGLCVVPSTSREDRLDKRRPLLILWRTLRRRPSTAAVLRRRILLDRQRWPGPVRWAPALPIAVERVRAPGDLLPLTLAGRRPPAWHEGRGDNAFDGELLPIALPVAFGTLPCSPHDLTPRWERRRSAHSYLDAKPFALSRPDT